MATCDKTVEEVCVLEELEIINDFIKCYLIGPMEDVAKKDNGKGWRGPLNDELSNRVGPSGNTVHVFDPTVEEEAKVGYDTEEFHTKMHGWILSGNLDLVRKYMDIIWKGKTYIIDDPKTGKPVTRHIQGDIDYVLHSNFLVLYLEEGDRPCGTYGEAMLAYVHNIPIYLIRTMPKSKYSKTLLGWVLGSGGAIFENQTQLLEFIDKKYKLKKRKPVKKEKVDDK